MRLLALLLAGPTIWAIAFSLVYALHGAGCELGWLDIDLGIASLHRLAMLAGWLAGLAACAFLLLRLPAGPALHRWLPRAGAWIGLGATVFTLFPILVTTSCQPALWW